MSRKTSGNRFEKQIWETVMIKKCFSLLQTIIEAITFGDKRSVWSTLFLLNVFTALKGTHLYIFIWSCQNVCDALSFLMDNIYIRFGTNLYRQIVVIPMGTNCAPLVADLFLF